ncbi:MAG: ribonuclease P protein component [Terriglobales bacterium]|jgi:ribonuclease P protein component
MPFVEDCEVVIADAPSRSENGRAKPGAEFPPGARLLKHSDFERVYKQGRRHFSPHMTVFYLPQADALQHSEVNKEAKKEVTKDVQTARVGFTVGRVLGGAVQRNRIRRRLREAVRLRRSTFKPLVDIVINPKKSILTLEFTTVLEEVGRAFDVITKKLAEKQK